MINRCGQASCHGYAASNPLRLREPGGVQAAKTTHNNLQSVLSYVGDNPAARSRLLEYASRAHGSWDSPPLTERDGPLLEQLRQWVLLVQSPVVTAEATALATPAALQPVPLGGQPLRPVPASGAEGLPPHPGGARLLPTGASGAQPPTIGELDGLGAMIVRQSTSANPSLPADPFDPAEFHRLKHGPRSDGQTGVAPPVERP